MTRVAADLRAMAAEAPPTALTTEGASQVVAKKPTVPSAGAPTESTAKTSAMELNSIATDDRGTHSTQTGAGRATNLMTVPRARKMNPATSTDAKSALNTKTAFLRPAWRMFSHGARHVGRAIEAAAPWAGHAVTYGGALMTAKGVYDMLRAEKERKVQLRAEREARSAQEARDLEFHGARMRMLDAATKAHGFVPLSFDAPDHETGLSMDPGTGRIHPMVDPMVIQPTDLRKVGTFNPRQPFAEPRLPGAEQIGAPQVKKPGIFSRLMSDADHAVGAPLAHAIGPQGIHFDHPQSPTLRV
jgi:hypothetical protein